MSSYFDSDEYLSYLRKHYGVTGHDVAGRDAYFTGPDFQLAMGYLDLLKIRSEDKVLEVGCGLGSLLKGVHDLYGVRPYGIDVSKKVVEGAIARVGGICSEIRASAAEMIPHSDALFDEVFLWGVFDLTDQTRSLSEIARVTKVGGRILLTGKNDIYHEDDVQAREAEEAVKRKGMPNHFTDFDKMIELTKQLGLKVELERFFERRGDFAKNQFQTKRPDRFYEYLILLKKERQVQIRNMPYSVICSVSSRTSHQ
jgi:cyclopropane fatty-acyl-phospholipid synthase-like methyltransferase